MTDILVRGMEMPDGCDSCKLNANGRGCSITGKNYESDTMVLMDFDEYTQRLKDCPLVVLPEHGDLIDVDEYRMSLNKTLIYENDIGKDEGIKIGLQKAYSRLVDAPVIVPSEKGETQ